MSLNIKLIGLFLDTLFEINNNSCTSPKNIGRDHLIHNKKIKMV